MLPHYHFIFSLIVVFILLLLKFQWWQIALFFIAAFFIDIDHYFYFIYKKKSWNLKEAYLYFYNFNKRFKKGNNRKNKVELLMIFHNIETLILFIILTFISFNIFFPLLLGIIVHYSLDTIVMLTCKEKKYKRPFSLFYYLLKNGFSKKQHN